MKMTEFNAACKRGVYEAVKGFKAEQVDDFVLGAGCPCVPVVCPRDGERGGGRLPGSTCMRLVERILR